MGDLGQPSGIRALELAALLALSGAVRGPDWPRRTAALARGGAWNQRLTSTEQAALADLILIRAMSNSASSNSRGYQYACGRTTRTVRGTRSTPCCAVPMRPAEAA